MKHDDEAGTDFRERLVACSADAVAMVTIATHLDDDNVPSVERTDALTEQVLYVLNRRQGERKRDQAKRVVDTISTLAIFTGGMVAAMAEVTGQDVDEMTGQLGALIALAGAKFVADPNFMPGDIEDIVGDGS